jgi:MinD superfamily P-loop ATPase
LDKALSIGIPPNQKAIRIGVASGKGGTGKTTFAVNLARTWQNQYRVLFLDCDVEAPDAYLFLKPVINHTLQVDKRIPTIDPLKCTYCGICAAACQFHAISILNHALMPQPRALVFPDLCHDCGVCAYVCPENAISEKPQRMGELNFGAVTETLQFAAGQLDIGQPTAAPIIHALKTNERLDQSDFDILVHDAPPGTSCSVVETIRDADFILLVTEPTPFGIHDLGLMVQLVQEMNKPAAIIINRDGIGTERLNAQIAEMAYPVIFRLPFRQEFARVISNGELLVEHFPEVSHQFETLSTAILDRVRQRSKA